MTIDGGNILANTSQSTAGGLYIQLGGQVTFESGLIGYNKTTTKYGAGVYVVGSMTMNGGAISYNQSPVGGAGLSVVGNQTGFTMNGGEISYNNGGTSGGAIFLGESSLVTINGGDITNNHAQHGGGITLSQSTSKLVLNGGNITNNKADLVGGGIYYNNGLVEVKGDVKVTDNTIGTGETEKANNVHLNNADDSVHINVTGAITVSDEFTGKIGFTKQSGTGTVASGSNGYTMSKEVAECFVPDQTSSDTNAYMVYKTDENGVIRLVPQATLPTTENPANGNEFFNIEKDYSADIIDVTTLPLFKSTTGDISYEITELTGKGNIDNTNLTVTSVGTFKVTATVQPTIEHPLLVGTATLTIKPIPVTVSGITCVPRGPSTNNFVDLSSDSATITGIINDDNVTINLNKAYGQITTTDYDDFDKYYKDNDGKATFSATIHNVALGGEHGSNYYIESVNQTSDVTINYAMPYMALPTATDITYGQNEGNINLTGGKVVIKLNGEYVDITDCGTFEKATPSTETKDVGDYEIGVIFNVDETELVKLFNNDTDNANYTALLTQLEVQKQITYTINPAPVIITIENSVNPTNWNSISIVAKTVDGKTLILGQIDENDNSKIKKDVNGDYTGDYYVARFYIDNGIHYTTDIPAKEAEAKVHYIGAFFTPNYVHAGTANGSAKQVGSIYMDALGDGETAFTPYTITYKENESSTAETITAYAGDIIVLPEIENTSVDTKYIGWKDGDGKTYDFLSRHTVSGDINFVGNQVKLDTTISGTITGTDIDGKANTTLSDISIHLLQGNKLIDAVHTDASGEYSFNVPSGRYTLVVYRDQYNYQNVSSIFIDATKGNVTKNVNLPNENTSLYLNVDAGLTGITVDGLSSLAQENQELTLNIDSVNNHDSNVAYQELLAKGLSDGMTTHNIKNFYNIYTSEGIETSTANANNLSSPITLYIPISGMYQGYAHYDIYVYNYETGEISSLTQVGETPSTTPIMRMASSTRSAEPEGEYFELLEGGILKLKVKNAGLYAMTFYNEPSLSEIAKTEVYSDTNINFQDYFSLTAEELAITTFNVKQMTGTCQVDYDNNTLKVKKIGKFEIVANVPELNSTTARKIITVKLEVTPKELTVDDLKVAERSYISGDYSCTVLQSGTLAGIINNDNVTINVTNATATMDDTVKTAYDAFVPDNINNGECTFNVTIGNLALSGEHKGNYEITTTGSDFIATLKTKTGIPQFNLPTASSITFGNDLSSSSLVGGSVKVQATDGSQTWTEAKGRYEWTNTSSIGANYIATLDVGTYSQTVKFVEGETNGEGEFIPSTVINTAIKDVTYSIPFEITPIDVVFTISSNNVEYVKDMTQSPIVECVADDGTYPSKGTDYVISYVYTNEQGDEVEVNSVSEPAIYKIKISFNTNNHNIDGQNASSGIVGTFTIYEKQTNLGSFTPITNKNHQTTVDFGGGSGTTDSFKPGNSYVVDKGNLSKEGYDFAGWQDSDGNIYEVGDNMKLPSKNITLTALWTKNVAGNQNYITVTYSNENANFNYDISAKAYEIDGQITIQSIGKTSYTTKILGFIPLMKITLTGWQDQDGTEYQMNQSIKAEKDLTLTPITQSQFVFPWWIPLIAVGGIGVIIATTKRKKK